MAAGVFITLEGVEGSGKTTQAGVLGDALRKSGRRITVTHEPGGTRAGETIRAIFLDPAVSLDVAAELLLVLADRAQHVREKLRPALAAGEIVISDRYSDSTTAYQGYGRGFDLKDRRNPGHFGLANLRDRAAAVGGTTRIDSAPGEGTRIIVRLPIPEGENARP